MLADIKKTAVEAFADDCAGREKILRLLLLRCGSIGVRLDESAAAARVADKYFRNKEKTKENALKCYKYLLSKGFSYDTAKSATDKVISYEDEDF